MWVCILLSDLSFQILIISVATVAMLLFTRMLVKGYKIHRPEGRTGTYIALPHNSDISNPDNPAR